MSRVVVLVVVVMTLSLSTSAMSETVPTSMSESGSPVLSSHRVSYSAPRLQLSSYRAETLFKSRGMHHLYFLTRSFLDLVLKDDVVPEYVDFDLYVDAIVEGKALTLETEEAENDDLRRLSVGSRPLLLHYIGLATVFVFGLLLSLSLPLVCLAVFCGRCCGKCGSYPEHFDKRSDACKRFSLGVLLATLVILAMFGVVCSYVTTLFVAQGVRKLPQRLQDDLGDASLYLDNTKLEVKAALVVNFNELEEGLGLILDESGPILKRRLAHVTEAVAIDDLSHIVSNLGEVKRSLRSIENDAATLQSKVDQLRLGLDGTRRRLTSALGQCQQSSACRLFLSEFNLTQLSITEEFERLELPDLSLIVKDISALMENDIERKVRGGQAQLDRVKVDIEQSIADIRPRIKAEIRLMGDKLRKEANTIDAVLTRVDDVIVDESNQQLPLMQPFIDEYAHYIVYIGVGMATMLLLLLFCYICGLFYGFCGQRPGNYYGDDCCNTGTGANWLLLATYLTFIFSSVLLFIIANLFVVGALVDKAACDTLKDPSGSNLALELDRRFSLELKKHHDGSDNKNKWLPIPDEASNLTSLSIVDFIDKCHNNDTLYTILEAETNVYDVESLRDWRELFGIVKFVDDLKSKIRLDDLKGIEILSPEAERELKELADLKISDLNFESYTSLVDESITSINLIDFTSKLRRLRERLSRSQARVVGAAIDNEVLFLEQMQKVVMDMKLASRDLANSVKTLKRQASTSHESNTGLSSKARHQNLTEALHHLIGQARKASSFLRSEGPQLISKLADDYVDETLGLIDDYVDRVIDLFQSKIGRCGPLSRSYNATVLALCNHIVLPFNGFWMAVGWCVMLFLISTPIAISLVSLYRKSEPYPGPLVELIPSNDQEHVTSGPKSNKKRRGRGHRRQPSEFLPDSAHYRAQGYSYAAANNRFHDMAPRNNSGNRSGNASNEMRVLGGNNNSSGNSNGVNNTETNSGVVAVAPPRYSSNPSLEKEYERPPPYYYPGENNESVGGAAASAPPPLPAPNRRP